MEGQKRRHTDKQLTLYCPHCGSDVKVIGLIAPAKDAIAVWVKVCPQCDRSR